MLLMSLFLLLLLLLIELLRAWTLRLKASNIACAAAALTGVVDPEVDAVWAGDVGGGDSTDEQEAVAVSGGRFFSENSLENSLCYGR